MAYKDETTAQETKEPTKVAVTPATSNTAKTNSPEKELRISLNNPTKLEFIICNTGERNTRMVHDAKFILTKNTLYKIPLTDKTISLSNFNIIKLKSNFAEYIRILDVVDGIATIEPIIHGAVVEHNSVIGIIY